MRAGSNGRDNQIAINRVRRPDRQRSLNDDLFFDELNVASVPLIVGRDKDRIEPIGRRVSIPLVGYRP